VGLQARGQIVAAGPHPGGFKGAAPVCAAKSVQAGECELERCTMLGPEIHQRVPAGVGRNARVQYQRTHALWVHRGVDGAQLGAE
jgi:hypothetical protein